MGRVSDLDDFFLSRNSRTGRRLGNGRWDWGRRYRRRAPAKIEHGGWESGKMFLDEMTVVPLVVSVASLAGSLCASCVCSTVRTTILPW
jgi:hypothetical protein